MFNLHKAFSDCHFNQCFAFGLETLLSSEAESERPFLNSCLKLLAQNLDADGGLQPCSMTHSVDCFLFMPCRDMPCQSSAICLQPVLKSVKGLILALQSKPQQPQGSKTSPPSLMGFYFRSTENTWEIRASGQTTNNFPKPKTRGRAQRPSSPGRCRRHVGGCANGWAPHEPLRRATGAPPCRSGVAAGSGNREGRVMSGGRGSAMRYR